jgi:hypothetical protein
VSAFHSSLVGPVVLLVGQHLSSREVPALVVMRQAPIRDIAHHGGMHGRQSEEEGPRPRAGFQQEHEVAYLMRTAKVTRQEGP